MYTKQIQNTQYRKLRVLKGKSYIIGVPDEYVGNNIH